MDYAAATPLCEAARTTIDSAQHLFGNSSSIHEEGRAARALLDASRSRIANVLGVDVSELVFTASGSEADALALIGGARAHTQKGKHIVVSAIEHKALLRSAALLQEEGFAVTYLSPRPNGIVHPDDLKNALTPDTILVSIMYANNEVGTVEPIAELAQTVKAYKPDILFHTDASQAPGLLPLEVHDLGVDLFSLNAAKAYGPKGVGVLYVKKGTRVRPIIAGEQEGGLRGGTQHVALIAGFASALDEAERTRESEVVRLTRLRDFCISEIERTIPSATLNGDRVARLANNVHVSIPHIEGESILLMLDAAGIACATGSACNSFDLEPSHVLRALGTDAALSHGSIRLTFGRSTTQEEVRTVVHVLAHTVGVLKEVSALTPHQYGTR